MNAFRYQAIAGGGAPVEGVIEAEDRRAALQLLGKRGLFPSQLELCAANRAAALSSSSAPAGPARPAGVRFGGRVGRKDVTSFTREISALLGAAIPIPQALDSLAEEEEKPVLKSVIAKISDSVRKGASFSTAL